MNTSTNKSSFSIIALLFVLAVVVFLSNLGLWQLRRADEKTSIIKEIAEKDVAQPIRILELDSIEDKNHIHLQLKGEFDQQHYLFLDNRIFEGKAGFEVIQPVRLSTNSNRVVLVNRGWIPLPYDRNNLPVIPEELGEMTIKGHVNFPTKAYLLKEQDLSLIKDWPVVIQSINVNDLSELYSRYEIQIEPWVLRQDKDDNPFYQRRWLNINLSPERHVSYAVTWFGLAVALIFIYIAAVRSSKEN